MRKNFSWRKKWKSFGSKVKYCCENVAATKDKTAENLFNLTLPADIYQTGSDHTNELMRR